MLGTTIRVTITRVITTITRSISIPLKKFVQILTAIARKQSTFILRKSPIEHKKQEFEQHKSVILGKAHLDLKIVLADYLHALKTKPQA